MAATKHRCVWVQGWPENAKVLLTWWCWRVKMHICTCFNTTASPNPCIILWDQLQKRHNHHNLMHTCESSLGPFFPTQKSGQNRISHRAWTKVSKRALPTITKSRQFHAQASPWKKRNSPEAFCGNDEILLWLLFLVWKFWNSYVLNGISYSIFLGMIRDEPIEPIVSHRFLFQLSHQDPRVAKWAQRWRRS